MLLVLMFHLIDGKLTASSGLLFDLPRSDMSETAPADVVAMVIPMSHNTMVFFDDSRYNLSDEASTEQLRKHFSEVFAKTREKALLALADRRVSGGELMKFAEIAKKGGAVRILFAEKKETRAE